VKVLSVSVTEGGRALAATLPYEHVHGDAAATIRSRWSEVDAFVLFLATGAAVRIVAPLLHDKRTDPAIVCVDEAGRFAIALVGGHEAGGNLLARDIAAHLGAEPVITTASEVVATRRSLIAGIGCSTDAGPEEIAALLDATVDREQVREIATIDRRLDHPAITAIGLPVRGFTAEELAAVDVPTPSDTVAAAVGTPSVCEAAALLAAGPGATLTVTKRVSATATIAVARRAGHLAVVGLGPGGPEHRTPAAARAVGDAEVVIGYGPYLDQCADVLRPWHEQVRSPIGEEVVRAKQALAEAASGRRVALVCSGDAGVYAMASIVLELAEEAPDVAVEIVPGVTAALASAALLGAPLGHDHAAVSLSDLLTPWEAIERRLHAVADVDLVVSLYNPRSKGRDWQLTRAVEILAAKRPPSTPVGIVTDAGRDEQRVQITTIQDLDVSPVGMTTCVIIGSSTTRVVNGRMVTPRGYVPSHSSRSLP
jgi:cobalt-precorrin 5A hydrolase / precorrin-3B C17-methyltransferase